LMSGGDDNQILGFSEYHLRWSRPTISYHAFALFPILFFLSCFSYLVFICVSCILPF
jgi:hypothetical protein